MVPVEIARPTASHVGRHLVRSPQDFSCHNCIRSLSKLLASVADLTKLVFNFASDAPL
jgi:hypothetical protein